MLIVDGHAEMMIKLVQYYEWVHDCVGVEKVYCFIVSHVASKCPCPVTTGKTDFQPRNMDFVMVCQHLQGFLRFSAKNEPHDVRFEQPFGAVGGNRFLFSHDHQVRVDVEYLPMLKASSLGLHHLSSMKVFLRTVTDGILSINILSPGFLLRPTG